MPLYKKNKIKKRDKVRIKIWITWKWHFVVIRLDFEIHLRVMICVSELQPNFERQNMDRAMNKVAFQFLSVEYRTASTLD